MTAEYKSSEMDLSLGEEDFCEETFAEESGSPEDQLFDEAVGALEDILLCDEEFTNAQYDFFERHCDSFEDKEENRVEYTAIFEDYTTLMEHTLESKLRERITGFDMRQFERLLINRKDEIGGEIFDLLLSFSDFNEFKSMILAHKTQRDGKGGDLTDLLTVSNFNNDNQKMDV